MEEVKQSVLGALGVNWKLFIAQLINFGIVLFVLAKFVFKPLMKAMDERRAVLDKGLKDAEEAAHAKTKASSEYDLTVVSARKEAVRILEDASVQAEKLKAEMQIKAQAEVNKVVEEGKSRLAEEKDKIVREAKAEVADLIVASTEKVLIELMDDKHQKTLVESAVKKLAL